MDKKPPFRERVQHRNSKIMVDLQKFPPRSAAFYAECARIVKAHTSCKTKPGTLGALIEKYRASPAFLDLAPRTRADYQKVFDYLHPIRDTDLSRFTSPFIVKLRDKAEKQKGWRFANYVKQVLSLLFSWGKERGFVRDNPALGVRGIRRKRGLPAANRPWSDDERHTVLNALPPHMVPAMALMMYTGLGPKDALSLPRTFYKDGAIATKRSKTGAPVYWPVIEPLKDILEAAPAHSAMTLCANSKGRPWTTSGFGSSWAKIRKALEADGQIGAGLTPYGLRHAVATILREAGMDDRAIADALGDSTVAMARHYSKTANLKRNMVGVSQVFEAEVNNRRTKTVKPGTEKPSNRKA